MADVNIKRVKTSEIEFNDKLVSVNRVTKVTKRGRTFSFSAIVVVRNGNGVVGLTATLLFPRGLYYAKNDGSIGNNSVKVVLEYSSDEIIWNDLATDDTIPQYYYGYDYDNGYFSSNTKFFCL